MRKILLGIIAILFATPSFAVDSDPCRNLFNKNAQNTNNGFVNGHYLYNETGALTSFGSTRISEYIKVDSNTDYYLTSRATTGGAGVCWYDNNKTQISCTTANTGRKTSPDNAKYIRISYWAANEDIVQFERGTTATEYVPYNPNCIEFEYTSATGTVSQNGTPTPDNPIDPIFYQQGNMILRAVGDVADSYDATTGKITRRIGVKVFNGTEALTMFNGNGYIKSDASNVAFVLPTSSESKGGGGISNRLQFASAAASIWSTIGYPNYWTLNNRNQLHMNFANEVLGITDYTQETQSSVIAKAQAYLKSQYDAGTPYVFYYTLATPVEEDWTETSYRSLSIKIATTKYNETKFSPLNTALQNAISVVDTVVSNTITQAGRIATLQTQKQTRPDESCPAGKKCLLVEDASGIPHWYEIVENAWSTDYTKLQYISSSGTQWIDTGYVLQSDDITFEWTAIDRADGNSSLFGSEVSSTPQYSVILYGSKASRTLYIARSSAMNVGYASNDSNFHSWVLSVTSDHKVTLSKDGVRVGGGDWIGDIQKQKSIGIFENNHQRQIASLTLKSFSITDGGVLVRNMIPMKRKIDDAVGLYDTVNNRFYTNAGDGEFTAGEPVAE